MKLVAARMVFGEYAKSLDLILGCYSIAAVCPNDRFIGRNAALEVKHLRQLSCCVRSQQEKRIHTMGSFSSFAARRTNGGSWFRVSLIQSHYMRVPEGNFTT
jgi:hypothetical protein